MSKKIACWVHDDECEAAGVDPKELEKIVRRISRAAADLADMGLYIFGGGMGGDGAGTVRMRDSDTARGDLVLAVLDGSYDGGDGTYSQDSMGLLRGEGK